MANAIKMHVAERGGDPAATTLVASGGAGPAHAFGLMRKLHASRLVLPLGAGVMSALGMLMAPVSFDLLRTYRAELGATGLDDIAAVFTELEAQGGAILRTADPAGQPSFSQSIDMRYAGQGYELNISAQLGGDGPDRRASLANAFHAAYEARYGYSAPDTEIELVSLRVRSMVAGGEVAIRPLPRDERSLETAIKGQRDAYDPKERGFVLHTVYDRYRLAPGMAFSGPAIVEEHASTAIIGQSGHVVVDDYGSLIVSRTVDDDEDRQRLTGAGSAIAHD
jgi:N-methylhydantoinase A